MLLLQLQFLLRKLQRLVNSKHLPTIKTYFNRTGFAYRNVCGLCFLKISLQFLHMVSSCSDSFMRVGKTFLKSDETKTEGTGTMLESVEELLNAPEQHHPKENARLYDHTIELKHVTFVKRRAGAHTR